MQQREREKRALECPYFDESANPHARCGVAIFEDDDGVTCDVADGIVEDFRDCTCFKANAALKTPPINRKKLIELVKV